MGGLLGGRVSEMNEVSLAWKLHFDWMLGRSELEQTNDKRRCYQYLVKATRFHYSIFLLCLTSQHTIVYSVLV
jgi:hypothetical protein